MFQEVEIQPEVVISYATARLHRLGIFIYHSGVSDLISAIVKFHSRVVFHDVFENMHHQIVH
jgi:hypothetical protein